MYALITTAGDSVAAAIPSFTSRLNFMLPLIVVLMIVMFFLLVKSYTLEHPAPERKAGRPANARRKPIK